MKANELMIGDWVMFPNSIEKVQEVAYIEGKGYCASFAASATLFPIPIDKLKPIPLTPEILEKNGFTRYGQVYANLQQWVVKFGDKRKALVQDIRTGEWGMNDVWIDYVHEFQHVLKLCKIEKNIEL
jgi:hypothetical protein